MNKKQKSFSKGNTYKRIFCRNCSGFLTESHISDKQEMEIICKKCKAYHFIRPPYVGEYDSKPGVYFGSDSTFTAVPEDMLEVIFVER